MRTRESYQEALDDVKSLIEEVDCPWESIPFSIAKLQELIDSYKESSDNTEAYLRSIEESEEEEEKFSHYQNDTN